MAEQRGLTGLGRMVSILLVLGLIALGYYVSQHYGKGSSEPSTVTPTAGASNGSSARTTPEPKGPALELVETATEVSALQAAQAATVKDNTVNVELSEYAGYSGLIVANGGLGSPADSPFTKKYGFKLNLTLSEEESWSALNSGKIAVSATTADVLAVYGRQFQVVVPAQIGFSRGADGVVTRSDIHRVNQLQGKTLVASQFTESDFFIRYLAQEAGLGVNLLPDLSARPDPDKLNLVYAEDGFAAGDVFLAEINGGGNRLAGCVTWAPKTTEVAAQSGGKARVLVTNTNLLVVADILIANKGFAQQNPKMMQAIVTALLEGNRAVRDHPDDNLDTIAKAFKWDKDHARQELAKVHLSNLPENVAFFGGAIDAAGSFNGIYQSAVLAYGPELIPSPVDASYFMDTQFLKAAQASGEFAGQVVAIAPIRTTQSQAVETDPLLSKDIRFYFQPNSSKLDPTDSTNDQKLNDIVRLLQVSPGSRVLLAGHVDDTQVEKFRQEGGESLVRKYALQAIQLSKDRAETIRQALIDQKKVDPARLEVTGFGWERPVSNETDPSKRSDMNRRVEVQWFTLE